MHNYAKKLFFFIILLEKCQHNCAITFFIDNFEWFIVKFAAFKMLANYYPVVV